MKYSVLLVLSLLGGCVPATRPPDPAARSEEFRPGFDPVRVRADLEKTARDRFGSAPTDAALKADTFLIAKHYHGLPLPPIVQADGTYRYPDPPFAMLIRRNGQWLAVRKDGFAPIAPDKAEAIDSTLREDAFWKEPAYVEPGCTDAGASLLWLKMPGKPLLVRQGSCGGSEHSQRAIFLALDS